MGKLSYIPYELSRNDPFVKMVDLLNTISLMKNYQKPLLKSKIINTAKEIRTNRPNAGSKLIKIEEKVTSKSVAIVNTYDQYIDNLVLNKKYLKEQNLLHLTYILYANEDTKSILKELVKYVKQDYSKLSTKDVVLVFKILRKYIERENTNARNRLIHQWDSVKLSELKKITKIQDDLCEMGLTSCIIQHIMGYNGEVCHEGGDSLHFGLYVRW